MFDLSKTLEETWRHLLPTLLQNPATFQNRLARRHSALLSRPPRAWCLALRASDTRIDHLTPRLPPPFETPDSPPHPHQIEVTPYLLRRLCCPVFIDPPGQPLSQVADKLGVTPSTLLNARVNRVFVTHHIPGQRRRPLLYTDQPLHPAIRGFIDTDPLSAFTPLLHTEVPHDFNQLLLRIPAFYDPNQHYRDTSHLHPEHPANDPPHRKRKSLKLPPPPPDYAAYKWKDGHYLGYDWRKPQAAANFLRQQRQNEKSRARRAHQRRENPPPSQSQGSQKFRGHRWLCPTCHHPVNILYLPIQMPPPLPLPPGEGRGEGVPPNNTRHSTHFACEKCHRLKRFSPSDPNTWNEIITYLTNGLLYGHEIPKPPPLQGQAQGFSPGSPHRASPPQHSALTTQHCSPSPSSLRRSACPESAEGVASSPSFPPSCLLPPASCLPRKLPYTPRPTPPAPQVTVAPKSNPSSSPTTPSNKSPRS